MPLVSSRRTSFARFMPVKVTRIKPSFRRTVLILHNVPMAYKSFCCGSSTIISFWQTTHNMASYLASAASTARTDFSRPTSIMTSWPGKTIIPRVATAGTCTVVFERMVCTPFFKGKTRRFRSSAASYLFIFIADRIYFSFAAAFFSTKSKAI